MIHVYKYAQPARDDFEDFEQLRKDYECKHLNYVLTKTVCSNRTIQYRWQCDRCGKLSVAIPYKELTEAAMELAPKCDDTLRTKYYKGLTSIGLEQRDDFNAAWWQWYNQYLESRVWKERRAKVIYRAKGVCEACGEARPTEIHHLAYKNVGREPLFDLVAVCHECHEQLTTWGRGM